MSQAIENSMVNDRCWPIPKALTMDARIDELTRDAMFREWQWLSDQAEADVRDMLAEVISIIWRANDVRTDEERVSEIRSYIRGFIESWAENEAGNES